MKLIRKNLIKIILGFILIIIVGGLFFYNYIDNNVSNEQVMEDDALEVENVEKKEQSEDDKIIEVSVDIKGAIKNPGVYVITSDKKVIDVVNLAGGLTEEADTSLINLAKKVFDEMVVIIYTKKEIKDAKSKEEFSLKIEDTCICPTITNDACLNDNSNSSSTKSDSNSNSSSNTKSSTTTQSSEKININTATLEQLQTLSGIGESKAQAIIDYRNEFGNFKSIEDILNVSGIGESIYEKIKNNITV